MALALIVVGFGAPFIFTDKNSTLDFVGSGEIGDTMGGLMSPFINIAAVIVTGLAFYAQYQANKQVKDQFELQRFESQLYEMLRFHKEILNEIEYNNARGRIAIREIIKILSEYKGDKRGIEIVVENNFYIQYLRRIVSFVDSSSFLDEDAKQEYVNMLKMYLFKDEIKLIFYNWHYYNNEKMLKNENYRIFFFKYKMIYDLPLGYFVTNSEFRNSLIRIKKYGDNIIDGLDNIF